MTEKLNAAIVSIKPSMRVIKEEYFDKVLKDLETIDGEDFNLPSEEFKIRQAGKFYARNVILDFYDLLEKAKSK